MRKEGERWNPIESDHRFTAIIFPVHIQPHCIGAWGCGVSICPPSDPLRAACTRSPLPFPETTRGCFLSNHAREILPPRDGRCNEDRKKKSKMSLARLMCPDSVESMANTLRVTRKTREVRLAIHLLTYTRGKLTLSLHKRSRIPMVRDKSWFPLFNARTLANLTNVANLCTGNRVFVEYV